MKAAMTGLILCAALLASVMLCRPGWLTPESRPKASAARPVVELVLPPDRRIELLVRRKADKEEVARRLFLRELTLLEAAESFYHINGGPAGLGEVGLKEQPGGDDGERLCNQAISWARVTMLRDRPLPEVEARVEVLRRELRDHVALHGGVELPEVEE